MRRSIVAMLMTLTLVACGGVDDPPLGGPYGGTTDPTDPNGGQTGTNNDNSNSNTNNNNTNTGSDAGSTQTQKDSGTTQTTQDSGTTQPKDSGTTQTQNTAPTWTQIFNSYLAGSTKGRCSSCHSQGSSKGSLYTWLQGKGYISGTSSALVDPNQSCLTWYGGNMPTNGPSSWSAAVSDMNAWAAAGALNN